MRTLTAAITAVLASFAGFVGCASLSSLDNGQPSPGPDASDAVFADVRRPHEAGRDVTVDRYHAGDASADVAADRAAPGADVARADADASTPVVDAGMKDNYATPCADQHEFCDDFDDGGLGAAWDTVNQNPGVLLFDDDASVSPPRSLVVRMPAIDGSASFPGCLIKSFAGPAAKAHAQVDIRIDQFDAVTAAINLFSIQLDPPPPGYEAFAWFVQAKTGTFTLQEFRETADAGITKSPYPFPASFAAFTRVELDIDLTQDPLLIELYLDGQLALRVHTPSLALGPATGFDLLVGAIYADGVNMPWQIHYDNALIDLSN